jgi:glutaminyl-tRNA synthetase
MAVLDPVKLVITNYPHGQVEWLEAENNQEDEGAGFRKVPFSRELYIEREDFLEEAPSKFFRLSIGKEVRLKNGYIIKGESVIKDALGTITEIHATYDTESLSGSGTEASQRKVSGTLHWVSIAHAVEAEVRLYDRLFIDEAPDSHKEKDFLEFVNPNSLKIVTGYVEPSLKNAQIEDKFQFQRLGYFTVDKDSVAESLVFNKTVGLKDAWEEKGKKEENSLNNSLKEINKYFKVSSDEERNEIERTIKESIQGVSNFSLLQNVLKKNIANNKSSLLFANYMLKHSTQISAKDFDEETIHKLYTMSLKSESSFVRMEAIQNLQKDVVSTQALSSFLENLKTTEKDEKVKDLLFSM